MTLRERIADWISGGALTQARVTLEGETKLLNEAQEWGKWLKASNLQYAENRARLKARLDRIASQETEGANATVKRMARIARGEE